MNRKKMLSIDGGGVMGIIPLMVLVMVELVTGKKIRDLVDVIIGTSVGGIIASMLSIGVPAKEILAMLMEGKKFFPKWGFFEKFKNNGKYNRDNIMSKVRGYCQKYGVKTMADIKGVDCVIVVEDATLGLPFYVKSNEKGKWNGEVTIEEAVQWTFSAPWYFGATIDEARKAVLLDGGCGLSNCTLSKACIEAVRRGWTKSKDGVDVISLGCGYVDLGTSFDRAKNWGRIRQVAYFVMRARKQAALRQLSDCKQWIRGIAGHKLGIARYDVKVNPKRNELDGIEWIDYYKKIGQRLATDLQKDILRAFRRNVALKTPQHNMVIPHH